MCILYTEIFTLNPWHTHFPDKNKTWFKPTYISTQIFTPNPCHTHLQDRNKPCFKTAYIGLYTDLYSMSHSPPRLGDDHLRLQLVEAGPQILGFQLHLGIILDVRVVHLHPPTSQVPPQPVGWGQEVPGGEPGPQGALELGQKGGGQAVRMKSVKSW